MSGNIVPNRWMQLRQPAGFTASEFDCFRAHTEAFASYACTWLKNWHLVPGRVIDPQLVYIFFPAEISKDQKVVSLPIGGKSTLSTRACLENGSSYMLWQFLPASCMESLEEGLTERIGTTEGLQTNWRVPHQSIEFVNANPEFRKLVAR